MAKYREHRAVTHHLAKTNRDELIEIRKGKYCLREIQELGQQLESEAFAAQATSPLRGKVDREAISRLLTDVQLRHWNAALCNHS
jgi:hypothetical protein